LVPLEHDLNDFAAFLPYAEGGLLSQAVTCLGKIDEIAACGLLKDRESPRALEAALRRYGAPVPIVHEQPVCSEFLGRQQRCYLSRIEPRGRQ
jgi:hypothetical protein